MDMNMSGQDAVKDERAQYYRRISGQNMTPLWEVLGALVPKAPKSPVAPALWRYAEVREHVMEAGRLITANTELACISCISHVEKSRSFSPIREQFGTDRAIFAQSTGLVNSVAEQTVPRSCVLLLFLLYENR